MLCDPLTVVRVAVQHVSPEELHALVQQVERGLARPVAIHCHQVAVSLLADVSGVAHSADCANE